MKSFELYVPWAVLQGASRWLNLGTLLCLSWASADAAPAVELLRDSWGTPHVFATTETDGFFGLVISDNAAIVSFLRQQLLSASMTP